MEVASEPIRVLRTWEAHPTLWVSVRRELLAAHRIAQEISGCRVVELPAAGHEGADRVLGLVFEFDCLESLLAWADEPEVLRWSARLQALTSSSRQRVLPPVPVPGAPSPGASAAVPTAASV